MQLPFRLRRIANKVARGVGKCINSCNCSGSHRETPLWDGSLDTTVEFKSSYTLSSDLSKTDSRTCDSSTCISDFQTREGVYETQPRIRRKVSPIVPLPENPTEEDLMMATCISIESERFVDPVPGMSFIFE